MSGIRDEWYKGSLAGKCVSRSAERLCPNDRRPRPLVSPAVEAVFQTRKRRTDIIMMDEEERA